MIPLVIATGAKRLLGLVAPLLTFGITLPVWVFLAAGAWLYFDRGSAIREAVDQAVTELVAGEELAAERARVKALQAIQAETARRLAATKTANRAFTEKLAEADRQKQELSDEINQMLSAPLAGSCAVDDGILDRLRNR